MSDDPVREAEFHSENFSRVEGDVRTALRRSGCILPDGVVEALTCTVLEEALQTRTRMAYMVHAFTAEFGEELTQQRMERLETVLLMHRRTHANVCYLPELEEDG